MLGFGHVRSLGVMKLSLAPSLKSLNSDSGISRLIVESITRENKSSATSLYWPFQKSARRSDCALHEKVQSCLRPLAARCAKEI